MRLGNIAASYVIDNDTENLLGMECEFSESTSATEWEIWLETDSKMQYLWDQLEQHIKAKLAEKLGIEEPLYKEHPGIQYSEGINASVWSEPDITEMVEGVDYDEDYVDRDLIPESNRDNS